MKLKSPLIRLPSKHVLKWMDRRDVIKRVLRPQFNQSAVCWHRSPDPRCVYSRRNLTFWTSGCWERSCSAPVSQHFVVLMFISPPLFISLSEDSNLQWASFVQRVLLCCSQRKFASRQPRVKVANDGAIKSIRLQEPLTQFGSQYTDWWWGIGVWRKSEVRITTRPARVALPLRLLWI